MSPGRRNPAGRVGRRQQLLSPRRMSAQGAVHGESKLVFVLVVGILGATLFLSRSNAILGASVPWKDSEKERGASQQLWERA